MYLTQKHNRDRKNSIILVTLLLLFIFSISFYSFADNDEFITHKVTKGDTLWSITKQYNISLESILALNNIKDKDTLSIGQIVKIYQDNLPAADYTMYVVKKGESLWSIAQKYNLSVNLIFATNNIANSELISIGQEMKIPSHNNAITETNGVNQAVVNENDSNSKQVIIYGIFLENMEFQWKLLVVLIISRKKISYHLAKNWKSPR